MTPDQYLEGLFERLAADGCSPQWFKTKTLDRVVLGRRADFKLRWMGTRLHLFTIASTLPEITVPELDRFVEFAMKTSIERKGGLMRGLQSGIAVFPVLVSDRVDPAALYHAAQAQTVKFACVARPVVIDTAANAIGVYLGRPLIAGLVASFLEQKGMQYFPLPHSV